MTVTLNIDDISTDSHTRRTLSAISLSVAKGKRIVVVTGAGISCSCGIPVSVQYLGRKSDFDSFKLNRTFVRPTAYMLLLRSDTQTLS